MKIQFENKYYKTYEMMSEYVNKILCKTIIKMGTVFSIVAIIMVTVTGISQDYVLMAVFGVCLILFAFSTIVAPRIILNQLIESDQRMHKGESLETVVQFGDDISITKGSSSSKAEYSQIIKVHYLKKSWVIMFGKSNGIMLSPDHFTIGETQDFKKFIKEKSI
ncbi:MAG: YcxB family protein [Anaerovoracaceae bacterium]